MRNSVLVILVLVLGAFAIEKLPYMEHKEAAMDDSVSKEQTETALSIESTKKSHPKTSNEILSHDIQSLVNNDETEYAVFVAYPQECRDDYVYCTKPMRSASMIKVFIMAAAMEQIRHQQLSMERTVTLKPSDKVGGAGVLSGYPSGEEISISTIMKLMIVESDNTATNIMIDVLGMETINSYIRDNGYRDTVLQRKMMDLQAVSEGRENYTSVQDLGLFFKRLYHHKCIDYHYDEIMLDYLIAQTDMECFPSALPDAVIAHKTGELAGLYDDGGIVYNEGRDFVLAIMTENYTDRQTAIENMKNIVLCVAEH